MKILSQRTYSSLICLSFLLSAFAHNCLATTDENSVVANEDNSSSPDDYIPVPVKDAELQAVIDSLPDTHNDGYVPDDSELVFETTIQGYLEDDYMYAYNNHGQVYISLAQLAGFIGISYDRVGDILTLYFTNDKTRTFTIDLKSYTAANQSTPVEFSAKDYKNIDDTMFFSIPFLSRLLDIKIKPDFYDMTINIDSSREFPTMVKRNASKRRNKNGYFAIADRSFKDYEFDDRWFASPVIDLSLSKGWQRYSNHHTYNSDSYTANISALAFGLDTNAYISGNSSNDRKPLIRLSGSRTFLDEPPNAINLKKLKIGDIYGMSDTYFVQASYGRGAAVSSFKDLVMSADKTIDITGPLNEGWEVELYWNGQLLGYRQNSVEGQYNFPNIPVSYGLNTFRLVFYGPYGETYTEEKRYYSGTSPVGKGEIGYNIAAYQPERYLIEENETSDTEYGNIPIFDTSFYYGLTDNTTLMAGVTQTPDAVTKHEKQNFGMAGIQYALAGSSIQYNLEQNLDTDKTGHHVEVQGDVYVGSIFASYDLYDGLHSPRSYWGDEYLKDKTEVRFSANGFGVPYYISWRTGKKEDGNVPYENITARVSKNLTSRLYASLENDYDSVNHENNIKPSLYTSWKDYSLDTNLIYRSNPDPQFTDFSSRFNWRQDRYTYYTAEYRRDLEEKVDYYSLSGSRIFDFGGLSLTLELDSRHNFYSYLTYNISFAKEPDHASLLTSAYSKLGSSGSVYAKLHDDEGNPLKGVGITANNMAKEQYTDEEGSAFLTDLISNERTVLDIDMASLEDLSLKPDSESKKLVLRPGAVREVDITFKHYGSVEGQIDNPEGKRMYGYKATALDTQGEEIASSFSDMDGYFIIPDVPYGTWDIQISKEGNVLGTIKDVVVNDLYIAIENNIVTPGSASSTPQSEEAFEETSDTQTAE